MMLIELLVVMLIGGVVMLVLGMRGRRIDDHPICRGCGFDLFGLPAGSVVCSECGADVKRKGAVRVGHRQRRWGLVGGGVAVLLPVVVLLGAAAWVNLRNVDVNQYKPVWWLLSDAEKGAASARDAALRELVSRLAAGKLSGKQINKGVDRGLAIQGDLKQPWPRGWGDFVEAAEGGGKVPAEKWQRYLKQALETGLKLDTRLRVRKGAVLPIRTSTGNARVGQKQRLWVEYSYKKLELDGVECVKRQGNSGGGMSMSSSGGGASWWPLAADDPVFAKLTEGQHTVRQTMDVKLCDQSKPLKSGGYAVLWQTTLAREAKWELVNGQTVKVVKDAGLREAVEKALKATRQDPANSRYVSLNIDAREPPVGLAFDVFVRQGEKEWKVGSVAFAAKKAAGWSVGGSAAEVTAEAFDVVLRPSVAAAEGHVEQDELWDGEVVIRGVGGK
ncbi:MAG: hypothetical protein NTU53_14280 [Planctomycetota bacterium]|nr:hypothetical protein [Planctomycetota bacterium]